jgi:hypothetical protein
MAPKAKPKGPKKKRVPDLVRRERALAATMNQFAGKAFDLGASDCVQLVHYHLKQMGHKGLPDPSGYSSPVGVGKKLKTLGFANLEELFDSLLPRIAPAFMLPGDIALVKSEKGAPAWRSGTVVISVGRKFLGWHPDADLLAIIAPDIEAPFVAAWRC